MIILQVLAYLIGIIASLSTIAWTIHKWGFENTAKGLVRLLMLIALSCFSLFLIVAFLSVVLQMSFVSFPGPSKSADQANRKPFTPSNQFRSAVSTEALQQNPALQPKARSGNNGPPKKIEPPGKTKTPPASEKPAPKEKTVVGVWAPVSLAYHGNTTSGVECDKMELKFTLSSGSGTMEKKGRLIYECKYTVNQSPEPNTINMICSSADGQGKFLGIYKLGNDKLTVCLAEPNHPRPLEFTSPPNSHRRVIVYRRLPEMLPPSELGQPRLPTPFFENFSKAKVGSLPL